MKENLSGYLGNGAHHFFHRVYFSDTDAGGIVYHGRYLDMAEHARTEMLRCMGLSHQDVLDDRGTAFVVRRAIMDFQKPARMDDLLEIRTTSEKLSRFKLDLRQDVMRGEELLVRIEICLAYISMTEGKPSPIPEEWAKAFSELDFTAGS